MAESKDQRKGWLRDLKVGDKVFVSTYRGIMGSRKKLAIIDKITPTGRINVDGLQLPPRGKLYEGYTTIELEQATEQAIQEHVSNVEKQKLIKEITDKVNSGILNKMSSIDLKVIQHELSKYE